MSVIKKYATSVGAVLILALAAIAFVFLPAATGGYNEGAFTIGKWGKTVINNTNGSEFTNHYRYLLNYAEQQKMMPESSDGQKYFFEQVANLAFKSSVIETAIKDEVEAAGYEPPEFLVNRRLLDYYQDSNGIYSDLKYQDTPEAQKLSNREAVKTSFYKARYIEDIFGSPETGGGLKLSSKEAAFIKSMAEKERSFKYVVFDFDKFPKEEIIKYGQEHEETFLKYNFSILNYSNENEAAKILASIQKGEMSFEDAAAANETKTLTDETGKLKDSDRSDINFLFPDNTDLEKIVSLKPSELSTSVQTVYGTYAIVRCDGEPEKPDFETDSIIDKVFSHMKRNEQGAIEDYLMKKAEEFYNEAVKEGFEKTAQKFNIDTVVSNSFALNYGSVNLFPAISPQKDPAFASANKNEAFYKAAFSLKESEIAKPLLLDRNAVVMTLNEEKTSDQYTQDNASNLYKTEVSGWMSYYPLAMLLSIRGMNYPLPLGQRTFTDFILKNPKLTDNFNNFMARNAG